MIAHIILPFLCVALSSAIPLEEFFTSPRRIGERSVGYCTFDRSQFVSEAIVGNPNGAPSFCESEWTGNYKPIIQVNLWWNPDNLLGIQAIYSDDYTSPVYGTSNAPSSTVIGVNYGAGDRWTQWETWYDPNSDGLVSAFSIAASNGNNLHIGQSVDQLNARGVSGQSQGVGNGFLFGFEGQSFDGGVTRLGALFLASGINNMLVTDIKFPNGPLGQPVSEVDILASAHHYNGQTSGTLNWSFMDSQAFTSTSTIQSTSTFTYGGSISFSFDLGIIIVSAHNTDTFTFMEADASQHTITQTTTTTVSWSDSGTLNPGQGVDLQAVVGHGTGTYSYTSTVVVTLNNGFQFSYPEGGSLKVDLVSQAVVDVTTDNNP